MDPEIPREPVVVQESGNKQEMDADDSSADDKGIKDNSNVKNQSSTPAVAAPKR